MKAILEFNLGEPDDELNFLECVKAPVMAILLRNIREQMYRDFETVEELKNQICELFVDAQVSDVLNG